MAQKKELTTTQKKKRYSIIEKSLFFGQFAAIIAPFLAVGIANYNEYFVSTEAGTKVSIGFVMAMLLLGVAVLSVTKMHLKSTYVTFIMKWIIVMLLVWFLESILHDLAFIMLMGLIGIFVALGLDLGSKKAKKKKEEVIAAINRAKQDKLTEDYKKETEKKEDETNAGSIL